MNKYIAEVGIGAINLIFFQQNGKLELVGWEQSGETAWKRINEKAQEFYEDWSNFSEWPYKIITAFVIIESEDKIHVVPRGIVQLVRTNKVYEIMEYENKLSWHFPEDADHEIIAIKPRKVEEKFYQFLPPSSDEKEMITRHILLNWPTYKELRGVIK